MSSSRLESVYSRSPVFIQNMICSIYGFKEAKIRFSPLFYQRLRDIDASQWWSKQEIENYQDEKIRELIRYAYQHVPYYHELMKGLGLSPEDFKIKSDLQKLPVLTKEIVRENFGRLVSRTAKKDDLVAKQTSGTTGKSLRLYSTKSAVAFQWAVWWRHRQRFGIEPGCWHVNFTGKRVVPTEQQKPPYWRWNFPMNQVLINMQHITPAKIAVLVRFLNEHHFPVYTGYPSIIHAFVQTAREAGLTVTAKPGFVMTGAESMLDFQKRDIERYLGAVHTDQYGLTEGCGNASHCEHLMYHEDFEFCAIECVDPVVDPATGRTRGKIVSTGFACPEFPLIRYEAGDVGLWERPDAACPCGRHSTQIVKVEGRHEDYVLTPEGARIMRFDYIFKETDQIRECQVVQEQPGRIKLRIVRRPLYENRTEDFLRKEIVRWVSPTLDVSFEYVDEIEREGNGKFRAVRSYLTTNQVKEHETDFAVP